MRKHWRNGGRPGKQVSSTKARLNLEELESRCLPSGGLAIGPDGNVWFRDGTYLGELNPSTGAEQFFYLPPGTLIMGDLAFAKDGMLWMQASKGLVRFDPATGDSEAFFFPGTLEAMWPHLAADSNDNIWFLESSANGSWVASINSATGFIHEYPVNGQLDFYVGVGVESDGSVWFGVNTGPQINPRIIAAQLNLVTGTVTEFSETQIGPSDLNIASDGTIWTLYNRLGFGMLNPNTQETEFIPFTNRIDDSNFFTTSSDGNVWFPLSLPILAGLFQYDIEKFDPATGMPTIFANVGDLGNIGGVVSAADGSLWLLNPVYVLHFNPANGVLQQYSGIGSPQGLDYSGSFYFPASMIPSQSTPLGPWIQWGDGTISIPATVSVAVDGNGGWTVISNHTYRYPGSYTVIVSIDAYQYFWWEGGGINTLRQTFTVKIDAPPSSPPPPPGSSQTSGPVAPDIVQAASLNNHQATFYPGSAQTFSPENASASSVNSSVTQFYQYPTPQLSMPIGGGMGRAQIADDPLKESLPVPPLLDSGTPDTIELLPTSQEFFWNVESRIAEIARSIEQMDLSTAYSGSDSNQSSNKVWTTIQNASFSEASGFAIDSDQITEENIAEGKLASLAFLAAFSNEAALPVRARGTKRSGITKTRQNP